MTRHSEDFANATQGLQVVSDRCGYDLWLGTRQLHPKRQEWAMGEG